MLDFKKCFGFTLAEVLITLGIIGIVAAMTIPALLKNSQDAEYRSAFKKKYAELSNVVKSMDANYEMPCSNLTALGKGFSSRLKVIKECSTDAIGQGCWHQPDKWYTLAGLTLLANLPSNNCYGLILSDGSYFVIEDSGNASSDVKPYSLPWGAPTFLMDTNGAKLPNRIGLDIFVGFIMSNKLNILKYAGDSLPGTCSRTSTGRLDDAGAGCAVKILRNEPY